MKPQWVLPILLLGLVAFWWILTPPQNMPVVSPRAVQTQAPQAASGERHPAQDAQSAAEVVPLVLAPEVKPRPHASRVIQLDEHDREHDVTRPSIQQNGRRWSFVAGVAAVSHGAPGTEHIPVRSGLGGFDVVGESDVPANVESYPIVQREDNGLLGIFTGTIKAVGERGPAGGHADDCPGGQVQESYPALKSYLLRSSDAGSAQTYFDCLTNSGRFKRVEWEILDHPRSNR